MDLRATNGEFNTEIQETDFSARQSTTSGKLYDNDRAATGDRNDSPSTSRGGSSMPKTSSAPRALAPDLLRGLLMVLQAIDHCAVILGAWDHGVAIKTEADGTLVHKWNHPTAWTARMLSHACAPGFTFLLGVGVVYFYKSRAKLGWSAKQMIWHFLVRALVLFLVNEVVFALLLARGKYWIINIVLVALAVDYFLAGLLYFTINWSEKAFAGLLSSLGRGSSTSGELAPLIRQVTEAAPSSDWHNLSSSNAVSWHLHNCILLGLTIVSIGWNHWLSPDHGHCIYHSSSNLPRHQPSTSATDRSTFFDFWFYTTQTDKILSFFPPLAWLSFAILGILYGRILLMRDWSPQAINFGNLLGGVSSLLAFVLTRIFHFGNLSEDCLQMPEQQAHPMRNQYLVNFRSFLYIVKYPPSGAFFAATMAFNFFMLSIFGSLPADLAAKIPGLLVFGKSALFFYVLHLLLYGVLSTPVKHWFGHQLGYDDPIFGKPAIGVGNASAFWLTWILGLLIVYPLCRWYGGFKSSKGSNSVWRFF